MKPAIETHYTASVYFASYPGSQKLECRINGIGKTIKAAKIDAQRQIRNAIRHLKYELTPLAV